MPLNFIFYSNTRQIIEHWYIAVSLFPKFKSYFIQALWFLQMSGVYLEIEDDPWLESSYIVLAVYCMVGYWVVETCGFCAAIVSKT